MAFKKYPYGYCMNVGRIVINEDEAKNIRRVFKEYLDGRSMYSIAVDLFNENDPYFNSTKKKSACKVSSILRDKRYSGADDFPVIVDPETFEKAEQKAGKAYAVSRHKKKHDVTKSNVELETVYMESDSVKRLETQIEEMLHNSVDRQEIRDLILQLAAEKYSCIQLKENKK